MKKTYVLATTVGAVDDAARQLYRESLHLLVGQSGKNVVLDLSQSNYITSDGIEQLVSLACHANTAGSRVVLAACSPFISEVLNRCKLNRFFEMTDTVAGAIRRTLPNPTIFEKYCDWKGWAGAVTWPTAGHHSLHWSWRSSGSFRLCRRTRNDIFTSASDGTRQLSAAGGSASRVPPRLT